MKDFKFCTECFHNYNELVTPVITTKSMGKLCQMCYNRLYPECSDCKCRLDPKFKSNHINGVGLFCDKCYEKQRKLYTIKE